MLVVAVIAPWAMGAAVGQVLACHGAEVRTLPAGRSPASSARASAGMEAVDPTGIAALHEHLAQDQAGPQRDTGALDAFLHA